MVGDLSRARTPGKPAWPRLLGGYRRLRHYRRARREMISATHSDFRSRADWPGLWAASARREQGAVQRSLARSPMFIAATTRPSARQPSAYIAACRPPAA